MIKKVLYIQPFLLKKDGLEDNIIHILYSKGLMVWSVYLDNFLKSKISNLESELLYLPFEDKFKIDSYNKKEDFFSQMDNLMAKLSFDINEDTLICISGVTTHHFLACQLISKYFQERYSNSVVAFGGIHASACPHEFDYPNSPIDYIIIGEGELSLYNLIRQKPKKQTFPKIIKNNPIPDINELPLFDLSLFDKYPSKYLLHLNMNLSRGCPFSCSFCMERNLCKNHIKRWRTYTPKRAIKEINNVIEFGQRHGSRSIVMNDPIFGFNKKWLHSFLDLYDFSPLTVWIDTRMDILDEPLLMRLHKKNFSQMYGLESCSKKMLKIMNKTPDPTKYLKTFDSISLIHNRLEYPYIVNILFNHPGETRETSLDTFNGLKKIIENNKAESLLFNFALYAHFPGTYIHHNKKDFYQTYGSKIYYPEWWKDERNAQYGFFCVKPSFHLSLLDSVGLYIKYYKELEKLKYRKAFEKASKDSLSKLGEKLLEFKIIDNLKNNLLEFINEKGIE